MDINTAATIIQRWFRSKLSKEPCLISHQAFIADYEIILDKQVYNANELYSNLKYSTQVPHSRRDMTNEEIEMIIIKHNPFANVVNNSNCSQPSSPFHPIVLNLTSYVVLDMS